MRRERTEHPNNGERLSPRRDRVTRSLLPLRGSKYCESLRKNTINRQRLENLSTKNIVTSPHIQCGEKGHNIHSRTLAAQDKTSVLKNEHEMHNKERSEKRENKKQLFL